MKLSSWIWIKLHPNIAVTSNSNNTIYEVPVTALLWPQQQQADGFGIHSEFFCKSNSKKASFILLQFLFLTIPVGILLKKQTLSNSSKNLLMKVADCAYYSLKSSVIYDAL